MNTGREQYELREVQTLKGHTDRVWSVAWKPETDNGPSVLASCSADKTVRIWEHDPETGSFLCQAVLDEMHTRTVRSCAWSPSGTRLATASFDATTAIWEQVGDGYECVTTLEGHENEVKSVSWNARGRLLATCSRDKSVRLWEITSDNEFEDHGVLEGHTEDVKMVLWHPSMDILFSCSYDNSVKVWAAKSIDDHFLCIQTLGELNRGHTSTVWALSFNNSGDKMVTCSDDLTIKIWKFDLLKTQSSPQIAPWELICTLSGYHNRTIFSVHWSSDGVIATAAADDAIRLFVPSEDGSTDGPMYKLILSKDKAHDMDVNCVRWSSPDNRHLASAGDDGTVKIWAFASGHGDSKLFP